MDRWCFLNCPEPRSDPFTTARPTDDGWTWRTSDDARGVRPSPRAPFASSGLLLYSHEDTFLGPAFGPEANAVRDALNPWRRAIDILILRDPYNLFASRRRLGCTSITERTAMRIWKQHAREFLGEPRHLGAEHLCISYNEWFLSRDYRRRLALRLGLDFTDAGLDRVAEAGGGSSFDGYHFQDQARRMDVLNRWRNFAGDPGFRALFDREVLTLARRLFGLQPPGPWSAEPGWRTANSAAA